MTSPTRVLLSSSLAFMSLVLLVSPIQAISIQQTQSVNASANASTSCTGDCNASSNASVNVSTSQSVTMDGSSYASPSYYPRYHHAGYGYGGYGYVQPPYIVQNTDGQVRLDWGYRGGTCHVRYTEANQYWYKYETATGCDDGGITISGLVPSQKYRFQVRQDMGFWSRPVVVRAR